MKVHEFDCLCFECVGEKKFHRQLTTREVTEMMEKAENKKYYTHEEIRENMRKAEQRKKEEEEKWVEMEALHNRERHLRHPFYQRVKEVVEDVEHEQILKGSEKYPEPFDPRSWTGKELVRHGLQELRDGQVYLVGLLDHIERIEALNEQLQAERDHLFLENEHLTSENRKAAELFNNEVNKYCQLDKEYNGLMKDHREVSEDLKQHKKALVDLAVAFSVPFEKMKAENEKLKLEIEDMKKKKKEGLTFNPHIEIMSNITDVAANVGKGVGKLSDHI